MYASSTSASTYAADFITVKGFNLNPSVVRVVDSSTAVTSSVDTDSGIAATASDTASDYTSFSLANTIANSGYLEVFTNGVRSLNNINSNSAHDASGSGSAIGSDISDYANYYNREPDYYTTKNVQLTDDRYLILWDMKDTGENTKNGYYPTMIMNDNNPVFSYLRLSGSTAARAGYYYPAYAMPQRAEYDESADEVYTEFLVKESAGDQMAMAKDDGGRYHHISVFNRAACDMYYIYDRYSELEGGNGWGPGVTIGSGWYETLASGTNNGLCLECIDLGEVMVNRYQYPKMIAKGDSINDVASVYAAYYDDYYKRIILRNFQVGKKNKVEGTTYKLQDSGSDNDGIEFSQYTNLKENTGYGGAGNATYTTGRLTAVASGSQYFDMKVTSDYHVILVYYDQTDSCLKLLYSAQQIKGASPTTALNNYGWTEASVNFPNYIGTYVSLGLDVDDGIHIAAFDANDSDLYYMYLPWDTENSKPGTTLKQERIDQYGSVGHWTNVCIDTTHTSSPYYNKPIIAYYNSTETGGRDSIKIAIAKDVAGNTSAGIDNNNYTTGEWDCMTVPAITPPQGGDPKFQQVCLDFDSSGNPVVGYLGTNLEFGKQRSE